MVGGVRLRWRGEVEVVRWMVELASWLDVLATGEEGEAVMAEVEVGRPLAEVVMTVARLLDAAANPGAFGSTS